MVTFRGGRDINKGNPGARHFKVPCTWVAKSCISFIYNQNSSSLSILNQQVGVRKIIGGNLAVEGGKS